MKTLRRVCAFVLALATLLSFTGCVNHNWSVKSGDEELAAGVYIYYMMTAYNDAASRLEELNEEKPEDERIDVSKVDILTATIDGKTGREWVLEETRNYCKRHFAVEALCAERSITLSDEDVSTIESTLNYMVSYYGTFFEEAGISVASVREVYENSYLYSDLLFSYYDTNGEYAVAEEDIKEYFSENYFAFKVLSAPYTYTSNSTETSYSDEEIKIRKDLIAQYFDEATKLDNADIETYNKLFANRNTDEDEKEVEPSALTLQFVTESSDTSTYGDTFFEDLKKAEVGSFLKYEVEKKGSYLVQKCDEFSEDSKKYKDVRETCLGEMVEDDFKEILNKKTATMEFVYNEKALEKYSLDELITLLSSSN